jgi:NAD(P)-dependent dehydrogenase (short-subunit alcohol dehydrogenase family)
MSGAITLTGKRVLITGGARGLGFAFAQAAIGAGAKVAIADIREELGRASAKQLGAFFAPLDLASPASVSACARQVTDALGGLDGLVNNGALADGVGGKTMDELEVEAWDRIMNVNARGTWLMTRAVLPQLKASGQGKVINLASDAALCKSPRLIHYVASKGAVIAMTRAMASELGDFGISVNAIGPGLTKVEATENLPAERHRQVAEGRIIKRDQLPEDVCGAVVFFLSDASSFITGQLLPVNGGFIMR